MYSRGDIIAVQFPFSDGSGVKFRPALVISNSEIEKTGDLIILMISSHRRDNDIVVALDNILLTESLPKPSFVKCHRLFTIEAKLVMGKLSTLKQEGLTNVLNTVIRIIS